MLVWKNSQDQCENIIAYIFTRDPFLWDPFLVDFVMKLQLILYVMINNVKLIIMFYHDKLISL
jgi:hypothetical protein